MAEIKIKIDRLNESITKLGSLKESCQNWNTSCPETVGGGQTINELESIATLYKSLNVHFIDLISNTMLFMENMRESFEESDNEAARSISSKAVDVAKDVANGPVHSGYHSPNDWVDSSIATEVAKNADKGPLHTGNHNPQVQFDHASKVVDAAKSAEKGPLHTGNNHPQDQLGHNPSKIIEDLS